MVVPFTIRYEYPFPWKMVNEFVHRQKVTGKTSYDRVKVTLEEGGEDEGKTSILYDVSVPWALRLALPKVVQWRDICYVDKRGEVRTEIGENITWAHKKQLREVTTWRASEDGLHTLYFKEVPINIPWIPEPIINRGLSIVRHYCLLAREQEVELMKSYFASQQQQSQPASLPPQ